MAMAQQASRYDAIMAMMQGGDSGPRKRGHVESSIQSACVKWFRYQYPGLILAAIPNGGRRDKVTGVIMKKEGVLAGMPDLLLLHPSGKYHAMAIEMKTTKGVQSDSQKEMQKRLTDEGYLYVVIRSFEEFVEEVEQYMISEL